MFEIKYMYLASRFKFFVDTSIYIIPSFLDGKK